MSKFGRNLHTDKGTEGSKLFLLICLTQVNFEYNLGTGMGVRSQNVRVLLLFLYFVCFRIN